MQLEAPCLPDIAVTGGCTSRVQPRMEKPPAVTLLKGEKEKLVVRVELDAFEWAPVAAGQPLGSVRYLVGDRELCRLPVTAAYTVDARPVAGYKDQAKRWFMKLLRELLR